MTGVQSVLFRSAFMVPQAVLNPAKIIIVKICLMFIFFFIVILPNSGLMDLMVYFFLGKTLNLSAVRSEERRVGKSVDLGGRRIIKKKKHKRKKKKIKK